MDKVAVIGAGIMGTGIAQAIAMSGVRVDLMDIDSNALDSALNKISSSLDEALNRGIIKSDKKNDILALIQTKDSIDKLSKDIELVIESATEDLQTKVSIFQALDKKYPKNVIFATNTSCLTVSPLAAKTSRYDKFIGMHFFFPAERNKLLEIVPSSYTSKETLQTVIKFAEIIEKISIQSADTPGFCVNRFFVPLLNEACRLLEAKVSDIYTINYAAKAAFRAPFGPFEIMNITRTSLAYHAIKELSEALGRFYTPSKLLTEVALKDSSWELPEVSETRDMEAEAHDLTSELKKHFQGLIFGLCAHMAQERIASVSDINLGAKIGLGWKIGPFELMNDFGPSRAYSYIDALYERYSSFPAEEILEERDYWVLKAARYSVSKGHARIKLWRPDALNALNEQMFLDLNEHLDNAIKDQNVKFITLEGYPKVFSAGADLKFFIHNLENKDLEIIYEYTELAHTVLNKIATSQKPVIALVDGIALGGGLELALSCHFIVATERSSFQFPETSIGLFPGLGGTQRLPKRVGVELAKYLILLGHKISAEQALEYRLVDKLVKNAHELSSFIDEITQQEDISTQYIVNKYKKVHDVTDETTKYIKLFKNTELLLNRRLISSRARAVSDELLAEKRVNAVNMANNLIDLSRKLPLKEGLKLEIEYAKEIFQQEELLQELKSVFKK